jgi:NADPH:quinone reductase-like Zn-dependent oxidoreductase
MKALELQAKGSLDHLKLMDRESPRPGSSEVSVRIKAAALNHRDIWIIQGLYAKIKLPIILGSDGSGVVAEVGEGVDPVLKGKAVIINPALNWGDDPRAQHGEFRILGMPDNGTQAEYVVVPANNIYEMPAHLSFEEAAALPLAGLTGYRAIFTQGQLEKNELILITGIGGGVAAITLQLAATAGGQIYVTSGDDLKIEKAIQMGAKRGVNYQNSEWSASLKEFTEGKGFDLIVDSAGGPGFQELIDLVKPGGRIITFGATAGTPGDINLRKIFWNQIRIQGTTMGSPEDFQKMIDFVSSKKIHPVIHAVHGLSDFQNAYTEMKNGLQFGKIVLRVAE